MNDSNSCKLLIAEARGLTDKRNPESGNIGLLWNAIDELATALEVTLAREELALSVLADANQLAAKQAAHVQELYERAELAEAKLSEYGAYAVPVIDHRFVGAGFVGVGCEQCGRQRQVHTRPVPSLEAEQRTRERAELAEAAFAALLDAAETHRAVAKATYLCDGVDCPVCQVVDDFAALHAELLALRHHGRVTTTTTDMTDDEIARVREHVASWEKNGEIGPAIGRAIDTLCRQRNGYRQESLIWIQKHREMQKERDEARGHVRNHHLEACETCAVWESEKADLETQLRVAWTYAGGPVPNVAAEKEPSRDPEQRERALRYQLLEDMNE